MKSTQQSHLQKKLYNEVQSLPQEYIPQFLQILRIYRESIELKQAKKSFKDGWKEAISGETFPVKTLWNGIR